MFRAPSGLHARRAAAGCLARLGPGIDLVQLDHVARNRRPNDQAIISRTRCARNHAERCWMPNMSARRSEEMPFDEDMMSQSARSHVETGRREHSIGVPVRIENWRAQARQR